MINKIPIPHRYVSDRECAMAYAAGQMRNSDQSRELKRDPILYLVDKKARSFKKTESPLWMAYCHGREGRRTQIKLDDNDSEDLESIDDAVESNDSVVVNGIFVDVEVEEAEDEDEDPVTEYAPVQQDSETKVVEQLLGKDKDDYLP